MEPNVFLGYPKKGIQKRYLMEPNVFLGYPKRGIACSLSPFGYEHYPSHRLDQNNLAHGVYEVPQ